MTQLILTHANFLQSAISEVMATIKGFIVNYKKVRDYKDTYKKLSSMSDRELRDIGICRGDIAAVSRGEDVRSSF